MGLSGWSGNIIPGFFTPCGRDVVLFVVSTPISLLATFSLWIITVYNKDQGFKTDCSQLTSVTIRSVITSVKCLKMNHRNNSNYTVIKFYSKNFYVLLQSTLRLLLEAITSLSLLKIWWQRPFTFILLLGDATPSRPPYHSQNHWK